MIGSSVAAVYYNMVEIRNLHFMWICSEFLIQFCLATTFQWKKLSPIASHLLMVLWWRSTVACLHYELPKTLAVIGGYGPVLCTGQTKLTSFRRQSIGVFYLFLLHTSMIIVNKWYWNLHYSVYSYVLLKVIVYCNKDNS